jgi:hypothetical protein
MTVAVHASAAASSGVMRTLSALSIFRISLRSDRVLKVEAEP